LNSFAKISKFLSLLSKFSVKNGFFQFIPISLFQKFVEIFKFSNIYFEVIVKKKNFPIFFSSFVVSKVWQIYPNFNLFFNFNKNKTSPQKNFNLWF